MKLATDMSGNWFPRSGIKGQGVNAVTAEVYISMVWRRGSLFLSLYT